MSDHAIDRRFYQVARPDTLVERVVIAAREAIYRDFVRIARPTRATTILDVGVSDVITDAANMLEQRYPYPEKLVAAGLGSASDFDRAYPGVRYVQIAPGRPLPYADNHFDIATSNAVLEHVGSREAQAWFAAELVRVSRAVFLTVPNRFFPVEHHTGLPFLHWLQPLFTASCRLTGKDEWSDPANLILMTSRRLRALFAGTGAAIGHTGLRLGPFSSNLYAYATKSGHR